MIFVEMPVTSIESELVRLNALVAEDMETQKIYAKGAMAALMWILEGKPSPSMNPNFPVYYKEH